jgi:ribosomal protein L24
VAQGEFKNLKGTILSVNDRTRQVTLKPFHGVLLDNIVIESELLVKYIREGQHVKVLNGKHMGETGKVVSVSIMDKDQLATILTDGIKEEITVNLSSLQVSSLQASVSGPFITIFFVGF